MITTMVSKYYGADLVMVSGMTPHRMEVIGEQYADIVVDVTQRDLWAEVEKATKGRGADVVMSTVSSAEALETGIQCVRPGGSVNAFAGVSDGTTIDLDIRKLHYKQFVLTGSFGVAPHHLYKAMELFKSGRIDVGSVLTASFPFGEADEAIAYVRDRIGLKATVTF
jgi:threonine dehydrogenase-like Zn-dependent dehydrogenase